MQRKIFLIVIVLIITASVLIAKSNEKYFKFEIETAEKLDKISKIISIDNVRDNIVFAYASVKEFKNFKAMGYEYEILPNPSSLANLAMTNNISDSKEWTAYPTYDAYVSAMYQFASDYPELCQVESIGTSVEGRELLVAKISDNVDIEEAEPEFFYTGQMHGDELVTYILMLDLIEYLLQNYGSDSQVTTLVDSLEIWINPLSNPDGTYAGGNDNVNGATRYNANSIDLNRNFTDPEDGDNPDGNSYQPETIAMMNFAENHNFVLSANLHSGAEVVNYPWDTWARLHADDDWYQDISRDYADLAQANSPSGYLTDLNNGITNGYQWYTTSGNRQDYMNYFHRCREVTLELSAAKMLPESELSNHWNYNREALLDYMQNSLYGVRGVVTDYLGNPLQATILIDGHDADSSEVITDPDFGNYHRMLYPGTYDLTFIVDGYDPIVEENITVTADGTTVHDVVFGSTDVTQSFDFNSGWDLISLNLHPASMAPADIFNPVITELEQIKNLTQSYEPDLPEYMNTLDQLMDGAAYWVNFNAAASLNITAPSVDAAATTIDLSSGWNLVGYPCQNPNEVTSALNDIMTELVQVKNLSASYDPDLPDYMNTLDSLYSGSGYWINVNADCQLTYPSSKNKFSEPRSKQRPVEWQPVIYPNNPATLYGRINGDNLSENDILAVFVDDECRGTMNPVIVNNQAYITLVINVNQSDEIAEFKYYRSENEAIVELANSIQINSGEMIGEYPDNLINFNHNNQNR